MVGVIPLFAFVALMILDCVAIWLDARHREEGGYSTYRPLLKRVFIIVAAVVFMVFTFMGLTMRGAIVLAVVFILVNAFFEALPGERWRRSFWRGLFLYMFLYSLLFALFLFTAWLFFIIFTIPGLLVMLSLVILGAVLFIYFYGPRILEKHMALVPYEHRINLSRLSFETDLLDDVRMIPTSGGLFAMNAVLLAFFGKKRLIVSPEILANLSSDAVAAIMIHEIAHDKLKHLYQRLVLTASAFILYLGVGRFIVDSSHFGAGVQMWGALVFGLASLMMFLRIPFLALLHRQEFEADAFVASEGFEEAMQEALRTIEKHSAPTDRHPLYARLFLTHPPTKRRIAALASHADVVESNDFEAERDTEEHEDD